MDAHEASYSITVIANVLGVTRAGYDAWKSQAAHRGQRALARRRSDEVVAWEHEVTGGTCGAGRLRVACCPDRSSAAAGPAVLCVVAHRLVVRPGPADPAAPSHRWLVVCVLPGQALCGLCGACTEREEARDCCRQDERADAHVHKGAGCLSDEESLEQPGEQEEAEEAPHASCCACHQLL